ncbi:MAG: hypothetical protein U0359_15680 [Byssovorax sp.]
MNLQPSFIFLVVAGALAYFVAIYLIDRSLEGASQTTFRYVAGALSIGLFFLGLQKYVDAYDRAVDIAKAMTAIVAAGAVFYEQHRAGMRRPVSERWKRAVGVTLGIVAIVCYFNGFKFGYPRYYHRWDQYHYYMGAKYFREMGYDGLYKCSVIAQDEIGVIDFDNEDTIGKGKIRLDMSKEVRHPDKKIRNLGGDNLLMPVTDVLAHPELCKSHFSDERWKAYKADVAFFRIASGKDYWEEMQKDHGFNPPPVWTILGRAFAEAHPATTEWLQFLASLDIVYLAGMFVALWWGFGWRVFAVGAIFWGCQSSAPFLWTGGAFLRQDWLFYLVLSAALTRKRYFKLAGASMVYAGLLRVFPGLAVIGWLVVVFATIVRTKKMARHHVQMLYGGVLAAALLIPLSGWFSGAESPKDAAAHPVATLKVGLDAYRQFYKHTLEVHDRTPLTNHMGLRVLISHNVGSGIESGRMKYTKDVKLVDPFEVWKRMRNDRYAKYRYVAYGIIALSLAGFYWVVRRIRSMWIAECLGQVFIILLSQLTCYYYSFMILSAPLTRVKKGIEAPLFGFAALSQFVWITFGYNDDKYTALTLISLLFCYGLICAFGQAGMFRRLLGQKEPAVAAGPAQGDVEETEEEGAEGA